MQPPRNDDVKPCFVSQKGCWSALGIAFQSVHTVALLLLCHCCYFTESSWPSRIVCLRAARGLNQALVTLTEFFHVALTTFFLSMPTLASSARRIVHVRWARKYWSDDVERRRKTRGKRPKDESEASRRFYVCSRKAIDVN